MKNDLLNASAVEIARAISNREITATEVVKDGLSRIKETAADLNAFTLVTADRALSEAKEIDQRLEQGLDPGPLCGVTYGVKNLFDLRGEITLAGSKINRSDAPAARDATAVDRLRQAGAVCLGALNMGEYAYDFITDNPHDGPTRNPHDLSRSAGGSSGGSGAAVAARLVSFALGTDTNGSIRVPASFCGVWGLRPTYGGLSRGGSFPFVDSLDTIGPLARRVDDLARIYDAISGADERDAACSERVTSSLTEDMGRSTDDIRIAKLGGYFASGGDPAVHQAVDAVCSTLGVEKERLLPEPELARTSAFIITASESAARHLDRLRARAADFDPVIRDRLFAGALAPASWLVKAHKFRAWWKMRLREIFRTVDVLIAPATPIRAPEFGQETFSFAGERIPLRPNIGLFTQPISLVGLPIIAAPLKTIDGLPCAVQLIAAPWKESHLLCVARRLEKEGVCAVAPTPKDHFSTASLS